MPRDTVGTIDHEQRRDTRRQAIAIHPDPAVHVLDISIPGEVHDRYAGRGGTDRLDRSVHVRGIIGATAKIGRRDGDHGIRETACGKHLQAGPAPARLPARNDLLPAALAQRLQAVPQLFGSIVAVVVKRIAVEPHDIEPGVVEGSDVRLRLLAT